MSRAGTRTAGTPRREKQATVQAIPTETGSVEYIVPTVGTFTISYASSRWHAAYDDTTRLEVTYGRISQPSREECQDQPIWLRPGMRHPHAPVLYGVELRGSSVIDVDDALAHSARSPEERSAYWIRILRVDPEQAYREAPPGAHRRAADIVADLVEDFLTRPDAVQLLEEHRRHLAPQRAAETAAHLREIEREIELWTTLRDREQRLLDQQNAWAHGHTPAPLTPQHLPADQAPARWSALTTDGQRYIRRSGFEDDRWRTA